MAFASGKVRDGNPLGVKGRIPAASGRLVRWVVVPGTGVALALWSMATVASVYSAASSIGSAAHLLPMHASAHIAFADPAKHVDGTARRRALAAEREKRIRLASVVIRTGKSERLGGTPAGDALVATAAPPAATVRRAKPSVAPAARRPLEERFYHAAPSTVPAAPEAARFGPGIAEPERSSRLALALAGAARAEFEAASPLPAPDAAAQNIVLASLDLTLPEEPGQTEAEAGTDSSIFANMPDNAPVPDYRPQFQRRPQPDSPQQQPDSRPARRSSQPQQPVMAYARPDNPVSELGRAFGNLFATPGRGDGVAVYDISAATVYMPDGQRLEAHSGLGHMVDNIRYVDQKMRGPTPPNTYNLSLRESRFHGVEAIRLTPADGRNKYGRDGLLAHTYMLRGGRAESNGCVVFKDYARFLNAFKKGKVRRLVVVPGRSRGATEVAESGSGA